MADTTGMQDLRGENISKAVTGFALMMFKLRQVCQVQKANAWQETYYQESAAELTPAGETFAVKGVGRLSAFPHLDPSWTIAHSFQVKHAGETYIDYEDAISSAFDIGNRALIRIARSIAYSEDISIYDVITADANVNTAASSAAWDDAVVANRDPIKDINVGIQYCRVDNYEVQEDGYILLSPKDYTNLMMNSKVMNNPSFKGADVVKNGKVGQIEGLKIIVSNAIDADEACIIKGGAMGALIYKELDSLKTAVEYTPGIKYQISGWLIGKTQVVNPEAIHIITNTQA